MDPFKRLCVEFGGIKSVITKYTSKGNIKNFLDQLENAIKNSDGEVVLYCLEQIDTWYKNNIMLIRSNEWVHNYEDHNRNMALVSQLYLDLKNYDFSSNKSENDFENILPRIFLSHSSEDRKYGDALERLISSLGVSSERLIYTSHPLHKIPLGENIYDYLRNNIGEKVFVIFLFSSSYLESPACLNEMGAVWVARTDYINLYIPGFDFDNPKYNKCAVDIRKMGIVLNGDSICKASMIELRNKISSIMDVSVSEQEWMVILDEFIDTICANE